MNIQNLLDTLISKRILVIGDVMLDNYYFGESKRISPEAPVPILLEKYNKIVLGGAANVAINIKKANQKVSILSVVGNDSNGIILKQKLEENGINSDMLLTDASLKTTVKTRFIGPNNFQMFRFDTETSRPISAKTSEILLTVLEKNIVNYDVVVISDYNKGLLTVNNLQKIIKIANNHNIKTLIDIKEPKYEKYKDAFLIKPNINELHEITGLPVSTEREILNAAKTLLQNSNAKYVLVTMGKDGMILVSEDSNTKFPCLSREVADVTGAGDTVISYLAVGIANNLPLKEAIEISNLAAGVEVSRFGTYAVTIEDIKKYSNLNNNVRFEDKVITLEKLLPILEREKKNNKKVVFTNGCFDIFHIGHAKYLRDASNYGDLLVVGVNSDKSVKRLKGKNRPIMDEEERMELLASLEFVSYVVLFDEDTPYELIKHIKPHILAKGEDYKDKEVVGRDIVEQNNGEVILCPFTKNKSTSEIIKKILSVYKEEN